MIMSKKTYAATAAAKKAAAQHPRSTGELHNLPSGRWCFILNAAAAK